MKKYVYLFLGFVFLQGCLEDISNLGSYEFELEPGTNRQEVAIPLVHSRLSVQDALDNFETGGYLEVHEDQSMTVVYEGKDIFSQVGSDIVEINDFQIFVPDTLIEFDYSILNIPLDIEAIVLEEGMLHLDFESYETEDLDIEILIYNLKDKNEVYTYHIELKYDGSIPMKMEYEVPFENCTLELRDDMIKVKYSAITANGEKKRLENFWIEFKDMTYHFAQGTFDSYEFEFEGDRIGIDLFEQFESGDIYFDDLKINLLVDNSFGVPVRLGLEYFRTDENASAGMDFLSPLDDGLAINFPGMTHIGQSQKTVFTFDNSNTNIFEIFNSKPRHLFYKVKALINETNSEELGFVSSESKIKVDLEVEIPLKFSAKDFKIESHSPFDIDLSFLNDKDDYNIAIEELEFKLITENGLPIDLALQLFFEDAEGNIIATLFKDQTQLIEAASIDATGRVKDKKRTETFITKTGAELGTIEEATQVRIQALMNTAENGELSSKFYTDYALDFKLAVKSMLYFEEK